MWTSRATWPNPSRSNSGVNPHLVVYEDDGWPSLLPLVYNRSTMQLTCGMSTLLERIQRLATTDQLWCRSALEKLVAEETGLATNGPLREPALLLNGRGLWWKMPETSTADSWVGVVGEKTACVFAGADLVPRLSAEVVGNAERLQRVLQVCPRRDVSDSVDLIEWPWELVQNNGRCLLEDWGAKIAGEPPLREGAVDAGSHLLAPESIRLGAGSRIKPGAVVDAEDGPVWIGERVTVQPHAYVRGPCLLADDVLVQPGAAIHENCSIGTHCKIGGEIETSIIQAYANKQHDGFLGHSYVGSWVNVGADSVTSDLKNTYGSVRVPVNGREVDSGETFVGSLIADHGKIGIDVALPTGAVIGFSSNVLVSRSPKFVPSFSWVDGHGSTAYDLERAVAVAKRMMQRRGRELSPAAEDVFRAICQWADEMERRP